ncbi:hypothetical protein FJV82_18885 [Mesorhizobium sp. WSM4305]|nr:hypothetical protein FJV82_18885 [Mesorhizobium sp. WSM4305]
MGAARRRPVLRRLAPGAPLCPAGHLPLKGGDWQFPRQLTPCDVGGWRKPTRHLISPLEGEMPGRAEGGAVPPTLPASHPVTSPRTPPFCARRRMTRARGGRRRIWRVSDGHRPGRIDRSAVKER